MRSSVDWIWPGRWGGPAFIYILKDLNSETLRLPVNDPRARQAADPQLSNSFFDFIFIDFH